MALTKVAGGGGIWRRLGWVVVAEYGGLGNAPNHPYPLTALPVTAVATVVMVMGVMAKVEQEVMIMATTLIAM